CPANSHYELCGSDCGHTCASSMNASCGQVCSEGCFCDEGFVRSGTGCVPVESCGCEHDGSYYKDGESFWTEGCSQQCECHAPNDLHCSAASCTPAQECAIRDGRLGCFLYDLTTCTVWGDPHYITFDHKAYDFQGTCRYVVATLCNDTDGLHPFSVEAKNERWSRSTVSVITFVFPMLKVNGVTKNVPVFLNGSDVSVYASGSFIYISANFGLIVKYNGLYELTISVPSSYRGKTCGLCGNFNGNPDDEFRIPSGMMVTTPDEFGTAWKVAGSDTCSDGCGSSCQQCTNELHARAQCEVIQAADGPLRFCHEHVDPARYFKSCVFDVCVLGDDFLCGAIQTYVSACQSANGRIYPWRQNTTCRPECPANSHYELCGSDCGHTCASSINASCGQVCSEGCFCDEGFVRSGTGCVPVESCGCEHDGSYYKVRPDPVNTLYKGCSQRCECHAPNDLRCSAASCTPAQECAIRDGRLGCFLYDLTTCTVWGDPHYITFDHKAYDFQGTCRYVVATLCNDTDGLHPFSVEAKNERWSRSTVSVIAEVFVNVLGNQVHMSRGRNVTKNVPVFLNGSDVSVYASGSFTYISANFGLIVKYNGLYELTISVPSSYRGKTCGLCGNFNGNPNDEFRIPSGMMVTTPDEFGTAWKVAGSDTCSDGCGSSCQQCTNELHARAQCEVIQAADGPLRFCHEHVDPARYFKSCVFDVCVLGDDFLCGAIQTYVSACQSANGRIYPWRQNTTCRPECPANSHYELCGSDCGHTCASSMNASCGQVCSEGCFCDEGFVRSGTGCVPVESCGCEHDGSYYKDGESFWTEGCSQQCECHAPNDLRCSAASCTPAQECAIRDGRLGCFLYDLTTCTVWGDPHYITFDHKAYDFQGTCRYVVATLCNDTDGLHPFSVEAKNERWSRSTTVVFPMLKVNGVTKNVPVFLNGSDVSVYASGSFTYISANFGLIVKYNGLYELTISVPSSYRGKTCGLCGNFNGNPDDEFRIPSGMMVTTPDEFGTAWKVAGSDTCSDGCGSSCQQCTNELHARAQCEVIQAADGPLRFCHEHVDPARYFKSCVFDVCVLGDDFLCGAIQTYVSACQSANGRIYPWRQNITCRPECPANSHYELCGSDCGHTCASSMNASCGQVCSEGCFCDEGFVRSGTGCVPVESCGCEHDGSYYKDGESFWTEGCSQQCECHAPNDLRCSAASCTPAQECAIRDGRLGCFLYDLTTCTAYDFQGTCRYVVATLCNDTDGLHPFSVEAKNERWSRSTVSVITFVFPMLKVNGVTKNVPVFLNGSDVSVYASGSFTYISANFGLIVKYNGLYELTISVPSSYRGKTCGLCGNFNGNPDDEFRIPSGMMVTTPDEFGTAWKVAGSDTCSDGCGSSCQQCTNELHARAQCEVIQAADGPLRFCHEHVDPARYFKSCVFDVCVLGDDFLCGAIQTYVSACQSANGRIYPWRQNTTCRPECPANSHYELCGSDCGHTCASSINASCGQVCSEGCFCDEGFVRSGTGCVPVESCGCEHDGSYYKVRPDPVNTLYSCKKQHFQ
uniref:VWFD domain-containing protein n=1 Tax=Dicentrarchus labrax TaxID=13489 RepID=A0A8C4F7M6_DICLA